jgi:hypothetical protein
MNLMLEELATDCKRIHLACVQMQRPKNNNPPKRVVVFAKQNWIAEITALP